MSDLKFPMPETVHYESEGVECIAYVTFGAAGINARSAQINLGKVESLVVNIFKVPMGERWRVQLNNKPVEVSVAPEGGIDTIDSLIWFDTSEASARAIETLFKTGKAPK